MVSIDEFEELAQTAADELPDIFFRDLSGGIAILDEVKLHPESVSPEDLYILGEYHRGMLTGKVIFLYYCSFMQLYAHLGREGLLPHIRSTLRHEFRHHLEDLAGERGLEKEDEEELMEYLDDMKNSGI